MVRPGARVGKEVAGGPYVGDRGVAPSD